jgi:hypothetical protein
VPGASRRESSPQPHPGPWSNAARCDPAGGGGPSDDSSGLALPVQRHRGDHPMFFGGFRLNIIIANPFRNGRRRDHPLQRRRCRLRIPLPEWADCGATTVSGATHATQPCTATRGGRHRKSSEPIVGVLVAVACYDDGGSWLRHSDLIVTVPPPRKGHKAILVRRQLPAARRLGDPGARPPTDRYHIGMLAPPVHPVRRRECCRFR